MLAAGRIGEKPVAQEEAKLLSMEKARQEIAEPEGTGHEQEGV